MNRELDEIDKKILALLIDDARLPVTVIARQVGVARTTVIARIAALEKCGMIVGYAVKLNQKALQSAVRAYVGLSVETKYAAALIRYLQNLPETETLCAVSGVIDYMLTLRCDTTATLDALLDQIGAMDGVRQTSTSIILSKRIDRAAG
ncbi:MULTISPECIES: Lrp/AsnC family transcriptional regulator [unclassified Undibacterium]|uniref:Lrp/AsnC family transcriptional regulator n=1 Tax=unclassified Undibacterium TaxID=2630295 RepID=UPI002AC93438|nr:MULTISPECIES: Lrp/AsnC family transcriptional regulator [unclassified Undibacterium]MEB0138287.1 Lrp/AsnC family transcriptional regulator [Undibacterium sp. CCC2.1]MEB0170773.1 Lrp/AsnC family transcriptional regulator [Undibacterium sp. CCC1.1]MEB0174662.1 Lrp/AsnC family transcriptional regulator [Undibacterium sp. CCC3.4]MEB0213859.1 Lrp/AsnC family transcriptional regulator [Undibacterium sp. 5I2]WPX42585.1 Lrp/AsnC family transcriptional regulator [Undibacterium sp. CCC3.4]